RSPPSRATAPPFARSGRTPSPWRRAAARSALGRSPRARARVVGAGERSLPLTRSRPRPPRGPPPRERLPLRPRDRRAPRPIRARRTIRPSQDSRAGHAGPPQRSLEARAEGTTVGTRVTAGSSNVQYFLSSDAFGGLDVQVSGLTLYEALSEPYGAELAIGVSDRDFDAAAVLGKDVVLTIERPGGVQRRLTGIVREVRDGEIARGEGVVEGGCRLRLVVVPALWMLSRRRDTRIFQDKT